MFLGNTQLKQLLTELNLSANKIEKVKSIIEDLKEKGRESKFLKCTDEDNQQLFIQLSDDIYIYSQQAFSDYDWNEDNEKDVEEYFTETYDWNKLTEEDISEGLSGFYNSLEDLKREMPESWKQIAIECVFENDSLSD